MAPSYPVVETPQQWGAIFTQPEIWRPMIREIWRRHGLGIVERIEPGFAGSNAVFIVNEKRVVKIFAPFWAQDAPRELEAYLLLAERPKLPVPRVVVHGVIEAAQRWPYMVLTRLPGARLGEVWPRVSASDRLIITRHLAEMIRILHATPVDRITTMDARRGAWIAFIRRQMAGAVAYHRRQGSLPEHLLAQLPDYLAGAQPLFPEDFQPRLLHCDLTRDHLLLTERDGRWRISGLIDFGDVQVGHIDYEWVALHLDLYDADRTWTRTFLRAYGEAWPVDERFSRRMMAYALLHRFSDMRPFVQRLGGPERVRSLEEMERALWRI